MMNRGTRAEKILHSSRYKSGDGKFCSVEDSRTARAAQKRKEQRAQREKSVARFRALSTTVEEQENSPQPQTMKYTKKDLEEMGRRRHEEMLRWREKRRRNLEKEKRKRQPNFQTGLYQPDRPKFLSGTDDPHTGKVTPWKTPGVSKPLQFHSGATPRAPSQALAPKNMKNSNPFFGGHRVGPGVPTRVSRPFRPPPGLGVSPLPRTPSLDPKKAKSFAPINFAFQVPAGVPFLEQGSIVPPDGRPEPGQVSPVPSPPPIQKEDPIPPRCLNVSFIVTEKDDEGVYPPPRDGEEPPQEHPRPLAGESEPTVSRRPRRSTRKSRILVTPPTLGRLRPRTPCSRSTRRSKLAHSDHAHGMPCQSAPKRRRTKGAEPVSTEGTSSTLKTPTTEEEEEEAWAARLTESPWITRSRGSSNKKKGDRTAEVFSNDLEIYFNGFPVVHAGEDGSPQLKGGAGDPAGSEQEAEMALLTRPTDGASPPTPDALVWGTPPCDSPPPEPPFATQPQPGVAGDRAPLVEISPASRTSNAPSCGVKRPSVSFAPSQGDTQGPTTPFRFPVTPIRRSTRVSMGIFAKAPLTPGSLDTNSNPAHLSPPVACPGDGRVSLLPGLYPPHVPEEGGEVPLHPTQPPTINEDTDLISWDSPAPAGALAHHSRRSRKRVSDTRHTPTPVRRSTRLGRSVAGTVPPPLD